MSSNITSNGLFGIEINPDLGAPLYQAYANNGPTWHIFLPASLLFTVHMLFAINMTIALMLSAAADRLFAVAIPHLRRHPRTYANNGPTWHIVLPASLLFTVALFGIILNSFVVIVTIATPTLRGSANYLMALICFCEVLHASGHSIFFVIAVTGKNFVPLLAANLLMIPSIFALCTCMSLMLSAAADRLFAVAIPHLHKSICIEHKRTYLGAHTIFCTLCGVYGLYFITAFSIKNANM
uniref:G-protein coupled receptors family 1 profile domain-containing protein n=1 Tax=Meloidogyne incognita TaxID=6306 RepID=A0A914KVG2_MELIC